MASIIAAVVGVGIVDIAPYMRRIIPAAVVVGIIIVDVAWTYRQVNSWIAATRSDLNLLNLGAFAGLQNSARFGIGRWRHMEKTDRQQASHQNRCE